MPRLACTARFDAAMGNRRYTEQEAAMIIDLWCNEPNTAILLSALPDDRTYEGIKQFARARGLKRAKLSISERFNLKVDRESGIYGEDGKYPTQCHVFKNIDARGYGTMKINNIPQKAHRVAYELQNGPIKPGMVIDHLCRNPSCVNPSHLEQVTDSENILRGKGPAAKNARKTHCNRGHEFSENNLMSTSTNKRRCKICARDYARARRDKLRGGKPSMINARKTQCPRGHVYNEANTYVSPSGRRHCRTCQRIR